MVIYECENLLQIPINQITQTSLSMKHRHLLQEEKTHTVDIHVEEGTGVRENAWNFQNVI